MLRPGAVHQGVDRAFPEKPLRGLLQAAFAVLALAFAAPDRPMFKKQAAHDPAHRGKAAVQINGAEQGLKGVAQERIPLAPALAFLSFSQRDACVEADSPGKGGQGILIDQAGTHGREFAFSRVRKTPEQFVRNAQFEHGVAEKLQALVMRRVALPLIGVRTVRHSRAQQLDLTEVIGNISLKPIQHVCHPSPTEYAMPLYENISALFSPRSIAVIGASRHSEKIGNILISNLLRAGFAGAIYPVNPHAGTILGLPALCKPADIPQEHRPLDLAVICLPAEKTAAAMEELGALPTKAVILVGAGFKEAGRPGAQLEDEVAALAGHHHMALLGPNSLGLLNCAKNLNASFAEGDPVAGDIGFFSQSGAFCLAIFDWAREQNFGFSSFVSLGNKARINESDMLIYLANDPATKVIVGYLESVENGPRFLHSAQIATRKKPVILLKAGRTEAGARAASFHTGALSGTDKAYDAAFRQTGIIRANRTEDLFGMAQAFASQPLPRGPGLAIITNAGGPGIVATDACVASGLSLARFSQETLAALKNTLPPYAAIYNPVDVADVMSKTPEHVMAEAAAIVLEDPAVHSLLILAAPTAHSPIAAMAASIAAMPNPRQKTVLACLMGGPGVSEARRILTEGRVPCYPFPEPAVDAIAAMYRQSQWKEYPLPVEVGYRHDSSRARAIIEEVKARNAGVLTGLHVQGLLRAYEVPVLEAKLARTSDEAAQIARQIGGPVALKISSPHIVHKTDIQGVALHLDTPDKIRTAFLDITARAKRLHKEAYIAGCMVQPMAPKNSRETVIGFKRDPTFGPLVFFGLAGIHVEAFKDIACRLAPLSLDDAHDMVREINAFPILAGMRGEKPAKFTAIEDILLIMSQLALGFPEIEEVECNPVLVNHEGAFVADARVTLSHHAKSPSDPAPRFAAPTGV